MTASNRQKKLLSFFDIRFSPNISRGAAGWEIGAIMDEPENRDRWKRYLYLTKDFDTATSTLQPYNAQELDTVEIPEDWSLPAEIQKFRHEILGQELSDGAPFDDPAPEIVVSGSKFMFTGKFDFGTRAQCQTAVEDLGGVAPKLKKPSKGIDYLVIGSCGSTTWKRGSYGNKIEAAVLARREHGTPAIVSEEHWVGHLPNG